MEIVSMLRVKAWHLVTKEPPPNEDLDEAWLEKDIWARPMNMVPALIYHLRSYVYHNTHANLVRRIALLLKEYLGI